MNKRRNLSPANGCFLLFNHKVSRPVFHARTCCTNGKRRGEELRSANIFRRISMAWLFLLVAGLCEVAWAIGLKYTDGFSRLLPTIGTVVAMAASIGFLGLALKSLPVGTAYAVWTGIGTVGTAALGIYLFNEPATLLRLACIGLILSGIVGLKITS
jgi:quaternary ammonium compound-resistance protein SugE